MQVQVLERLAVGVVGLVAYKPVAVQQVGKALVLAWAVEQRVQQVVELGQAVNHSSRKRLNLPH